MSDSKVNPYRQHIHGISMSKQIMKERKQERLCPFLKIDFTDIQRQSAIKF